MVDSQNSGNTRSNSTGYLVFLETAVIVNLATLKRIPSSSCNGCVANVETAPVDVPAVVHHAGVGLARLHPGIN